MRLPRIVIVVMSAAVVVITSISMNAFSLFLTPIEDAFGWSRTTATVPYVFAMLGWAVGGVLFGKKADDPRHPSGDPGRGAAHGRRLLSAWGCRRTFGSYPLPSGS